MKSVEDGLFVGNCFKSVKNEQNNKAANQLDADYFFSNSTHHCSKVLRVIKTLSHFEHSWYNEEYHHYFPVYYVFLCMIENCNKAVTRMRDHELLCCTFYFAVKH